MSVEARLRSGSIIVEVIDNPENSRVLLTVSKERYDEDAIQLPLDRSVAEALGALLVRRGPE